MVASFEVGEKKGQMYIYNNNTFLLIFLQALHHTEIKFLFTATNLYWIFLFSGRLFSLYWMNITLDVWSNYLCLGIILSDRRLSISIARRVFTTHISSSIQMTGPKGITKKEKAGINWINQRSWRLYRNATTFSPIPRSSQLCMMLSFFCEKKEPRNSQGKVRASVPTHSPNKRHCAFF